ncbi:RDD family protein [Novosphingobium sp. M1R2S20]|uniref:RDD family protein n=1 Tax=Novosphingobium rhizovicinum TaxID=3228928 RepID=A0ABV3RA09_9SPHN
MARSVFQPASSGGNERHRVLLTPEGVTLPLMVASRGSRAGALMLDFVFLTTGYLAVTVALISLAGGVAGLLDPLGADNGHASAALQFLIVVWIIAGFLLRHSWFLWFELGPRGATPGKRITGIRVAARDGGRLTAEMVIARNFLRDIELFLPIAFIASAGADSTPAWLAATAWFATFLLLPCFNRDRLRAGDIVAGTWVVEAPRRMLEAPVLMPAAGERYRYRFNDAELAVYGEYELQTLERILREDRARALVSVQAAIAGKTGRTDGSEEPRAFLEDYYAQLRARLEASMRMGRRKADKNAPETS